MLSLEYVGCRLALSGVQPLMKQVGSLLKKEVLHVWNVDDKLRELQATYLQTQDLLINVDRWQNRETALEPWLQDLDRYCYDIEDIVDDLILSLLNSEEDKKPDQHPVRNHIFKSGRLTIPRQIGELQKKFKEVGSLIENLLSAEAINSTQPQNGEIRSVPYLKSLLSDKTPLVPGTRRDQDKQAIISEMTSQQSKSCGVSIIGMDGLGKTSLARTILVDEIAKEHFPLVLSACVSGNFEMGDIVQKLVEDHSRRTRPQNQPQLIESHQSGLILQDLLCNKKSLIILDDLWSVTDEDWDYFKCNYLSSCPSWKILTTTRNPKVAEVIETTSFYLNRMTDEDCKKLIIHRANLSKFESESWSADIEVIARKCMGMPILANKLGLKLSKKKMGVERKTSIIQFKMDQLWGLQEFREVFPSLNLNEPKLPPDLKRCFAYCSLFPPTHEFNKEDLIQLWEVEGFIQSQQTGSLKQGIINQRFEDLLSRSILQPFKSKDYKKQPVYKMHEFNHEFAHLLASKAFCRLGEEGTPNLLSSCRNLRHLSLACNNTTEQLLKKIEKCEGLRTFLLLHHSKPKMRTISYNFFHKLQRLRLLDLSHTNISSLPKPKFPSKHLRCLDLSYSLVTKLPEPIASLRALQILKLKGCSELLQLPNDLYQLTNLTNLHVDMKDLDCLPSNIGRLTKLEVLDSFFVRKDEGYKVLELRNMEYLKEVQIFGLENIKDMAEAEGTMLSERQLLRILALEWDYTSTAKVTNASDILEGLRPHDHLEDLVVRNYGGQMFPTWLISPSCQLVSISLDNCPNCQILPSLAQLPFLKNLVLRSIHNVKSLDNTFCGKGERLYPCLELLEFHDMTGLVHWTGLKVGDMPHLRALKIIRCPMLVNVPSFEHLSCLVNLEINNCPELQSLPELPSSLRRDLGELIIVYSTLLTRSCKAEGADWPKIKDIPYVEIDATRISTKSSGQPQPEKDEVTLDEHQPPMSTMLATGNDVSQNCQQDPTTLSTPNNGILMQDLNHREHISSRPNGNQNIERWKSESKGKQKVYEGSSSNQVHHVDRLQQNEILSMDRDEHNSVVQIEGTTNEDQLTSHRLPSTSITTTKQTTTKGDDKKGYQRPSKRRFSRGFRRYLFGCFSKVETVE